MSATSVGAPRARTRTRTPGRLDKLVEGTPWQRGDVIVLLGRLAVGALGILVGWIGCSGTVEWNQQQAWVAVGIGGLVIAIAGVSTWILAGVRSVKEEQLEVLGLVQEGLGIERAVAEPTVTSPSATAAVVTGAGMTMFHRPSCVLVRGKVTHAVTRREAEKLTPCTVCQP